MAANALAPRFLCRSDVNDKNWESSTASFHTSTTTRDAKDLRAVIMSISRANPVRAGSAIVRFLKDKSNFLVKQRVIKAIRFEIDPDADACKLIVSGIKKSIKHHTIQQGGSRTYPAETFVKNVTAASLFDIVKLKSNISQAAISRLIGATTHQIGLAHSLVKDLLAESLTVMALERKTRKDFIRDKLRPYIWQFLKDDWYTRLDSKQNLVDASNPITNKEEKVHKRIWKIVNKKQ